MADNWGIKVSAEGFDVKDLSGNDENLILNTGFDTLKVSQNAHLNSSSDVNHNIGNVPFYLVFCPNSNVSVEKIRLSTYSDLIGSTIVYADSSKLSMTDNSGFHEFEYYIFYNS